jgi:tRNA (cmo5U34)-methyltransferase
MTSKRPRDTLYATPLEAISDFRFDEQVVGVFADMINRSVPGYGTLISMLGVMAGRFVQPQSRCYDLGCSLGAATLALRQGIEQPGVNIIAVDNSEAMVEQCRKHIAADTSGIPVEVICDDLRNVEIVNASVVVLNFTLQFLSPDQRAELLAKIAQGLRPGGVLILSEKITFDEPGDTTLFTELHHGFKRARGYSDLEISQKRNALENVLVPDTLEHHLARLQQAGFQRSRLWFQCLNFISILAIKGS